MLEGIMLIEIQHILLLSPPFLLSSTLLYSSTPLNHSSPLLSSFSNLYASAQINNQRSISPRLVTHYDFIHARFFQIFRHFE